MTVTEYIKKHLADRGVNGSDADEVVGHMIMNDYDGDKVMAGAWDSDVGGYQGSFLAVLCFLASRTSKELSNAIDSEELS